MKCRAPFIATQLNSTQLDVELSWVVSLWTPSMTHDADRRRALSGTQPVSAKQVSSLFITLILLRSLYAFHLISYKQYTHSATI